MVPWQRGGTRASSAAAGKVRGAGSRLARPDLAGSKTDRKAPGEEGDHRSVKLNVILGIFTSETGGLWQQDNYWRPWEWVPRGCVRG